MTKEQIEAAVAYVVRYGGRCRDCADEDGVCPRSGLPCGGRAKAARYVFDAYAYGVEHGYIAAIAAPGAAGPEEDI